ncbi:MAG: GPP34 family phosphoprotein [Henriciella sp.]|nr:GPP34 family phosphoprotein [Henriciella sp.]
MDITLPQAILLLSLNDETGKTEDGYYQPALAGAALADLFLQEAIELDLDPEGVIALRHNLELGAFLRMCDKEIGAAPKPRDLAFWISRLANQKNFIATLADELVHLGALAREKTKVFGLFERTIWPEASPAIETKLKEEMASAMFAVHGPVNERTCLTITLANAVGLLEHNFDRAKLAAHAERIGAICAGECLVTGTSEAVVRAVRTAIRTANTMAETTAATIIN